MDENKAQENKQANENNDSGLQSKGSSIINELDARIERLEAANKEASRINEERAELMAREAVYGRSRPAEVEESKEAKMTDAEFAEAFMEGKVDVR